MYSIRVYHLVFDCHCSILSHIRFTLGSALSLPPARCHHFTDVKPKGKIYAHLYAPCPPDVAIQRHAGFTAYRVLFFGGMNLLKSNFSIAVNLLTV